MLICFWLNGNLSSVFIIFNDVSLIVGRAVLNQPPSIMDNFNARQALRDDIDIDLVESEDGFYDV